MASNVANYFLSLVDEECGDGMTNLKLQKLLYYAQGYHLAITGNPLFKEEIEAWQHGPVVRSVYSEYKEYGSNCIPLPQDIDLSGIPPESQEILDEVYNVYGQFSAWKLRDLTHQEPPWKDTPINEIIPKEVIKQYFDTQVIHG